LNDTLKKQLIASWGTLKSREMFFVLAPNRNQPVLYLSKREMDATANKFRARMTQADMPVDHGRLAVGKVTWEDGRARFSVEESKGKGQITDQQFRTCLLQIDKLDGVNLAGLKIAQIDMPTAQQQMKEALSRKETIKSTLKGGGRYSKLRDRSKQLAKATAPEEKAKLEAQILDETSDWLERDLKRKQSKDPEKAEQIYTLQKKVLAQSGKIPTARDMQVSLQMVRRQRYTLDRKRFPSKRAEGLAYQGLLDDLRLFLELGMASPDAKKQAIAREYKQLYTEIQRVIEGLELPPDYEAPRPPPKSRSYEEVAGKLNRALEILEVLRDDRESLRGEVAAAGGQLRGFADTLEKDPLLAAGFGVDIKRLRRLVAETERLMDTPPPAARLEPLQGRAEALAPRLPRLAQRALHEGERARIADDVNRLVADIERTRKAAPRWLKRVNQALVGALGGREFLEAGRAQAGQLRGRLAALDGALVGRLATGEVSPEAGGAATRAAAECRRLVADLYRAGFSARLFRACLDGGLQHRFDAAKQVAHLELPQGGAPEAGGRDELSQMMEDLEGIDPLDLESQQHEQARGAWARRRAADVRLEARVKARLLKGYEEARAGCQRLAAAPVVVVDGQPHALGRLGGRVLKEGLLPLVNGVTEGRFEEPAARELTEAAVRDGFAGAEAAIKAIAALARALGKVVGPVDAAIKRGEPVERVTVRGWELALEELAGK
jgi:hypothetical protein